MTKEITRYLHVFLCHASEDKLPVRGIYDYLRSKISSMVDVEKLLPGEDWNVEIPRLFWPLM